MKSVKMTSEDIVNQRLHNQGLVKSRWKSVHEVVKALGALQSQDYVGAKWAIGLRLPGSTAEDVEKAMKEGIIIRTHVLRPTWHFVAAEDVRWMLALTAPRIKSTFASYSRALGLDQDTLTKTQRIFQKTLKGKQLIRGELRAALEKEGMTTKGMRFMFILAHAELEALICSGARSGKQQTYALLNERVPLARAVTPEDPLVELVTRYFTTHGPATVHDFVWWAMVKIGDVRKALEKSRLESVEIEGKTYWFADMHTKKQNAGIQLLPNYDEYVSYKDRSHYFDHVFARESLMNHFIVNNGKIIGAWKHHAGRDVELKPFVSLTASEKKELDKEVMWYKEFIGNNSG